jgi:hypothetical protein
LVIDRAGIDSSKLYLSLSRLATLLLFKTNRAVAIDTVPVGNPGNAADTFRAKWLQALAAARVSVSMPPFRNRHHWCC